MPEEGSASGSVRYKIYVDASNVYVELGKISAAFRETATQASQEVSQAITKGATAGAQQAGEQVKKTWSSILSPANLLETAAKFSVYFLYYKTFGAILSGLSDIAGYVEMLQRAQVSLDFYVGEGSEKFLKDLEEFAIQTPLVTSELITLSVQMRAFGFETQDVSKYLRIMGDAAAAVTGGGAQMNAILDRIAWAMAQIKQSAVLNAQDMRQLAQAGIPAWEYLAEYLETDVSNAMRMVKNRAVDSQTALEALSRGMERDFGGAMERTMTTVSGQWAVFTDQIRATLGEALMPVADFIAQNILAPLNESLDKARKAGTEVPGLSPQTAQVRNEAVDAMLESFAQIVGGQQKVTEALLAVMGRTEEIEAMRTTAAAGGPSAAAFAGAEMRKLTEEMMSRVMVEDITRAIQWQINQLEEERRAAQAELERAAAVRASWAQDYAKMIEAGKPEWIARLTAYARNPAYVGAEGRDTRLLNEISKLTGEISQLRRLLPSLAKEFSYANREFLTYMDKMSDVMEVQVYGKGLPPEKFPLSYMDRAVDYFMESFDLSRFDNMITAYYDELDRARRERISQGMSVLKETPITQADLWVSQLQDMGMAGWDYIEKWDEQARRMKAVVEGGLMSQWVSMVPEGIRAQGELATRAWASKWIEDFYMGMYPGAIDIGAAAEELRKQWQGKQNLEQIALQVAQAAQIPLDFVMTDFERRFGVTLTDGLEGALRSKDPARVMAVVISQQVDDNREEIEKAGADWFTAFFDGLQRVEDGRLYNLFIQKILDAMGGGGSLKGEKSSFVGRGGYAE